MKKIFSLIIVLGLLLLNFPLIAEAITYTFTPINLPGTYETDAFGINDSNNIVGYYFDATGEHGFLDVGGNFTPINVPGASYTVALGINNSNNIVGDYYDATGGHGFIATSVPEPSTMLLLGSGLIGLVGLRRKFKA